MKFNQLRVLVTIAHRGSIHEAARHLHITQPALSKAVQELETSLGATLLERSTTGTRLTPCGRRLVDHARLILDSVQQARADIENMKGRAGGEVTVGTTPLTAGIRPMAAILDTYRRAYPEVRLRVLEMRPVQLTEQLRQGAVDLAVTTQWGTSEGNLQSTELCRVSSVVSARKGHPMCQARSLRELLKADWVTLDPLLDTTSSFSRLFSDNDLDLPLQVTQCSAIHLALELCWRSDLLLVLSSESLRSPLLTDRMVVLDIDEPMPEQPICLVKHCRQVLTAPAERLYEAIRAGFEQNARSTVRTWPST